MNFTDIIGIIAGAGTTFSFAPQVLHIFRTDDTRGLSAYMMTIHFLGISSWIAYGILKHDKIIIIYNIITLCLLHLIIGRLIYLRHRPILLSWTKNGSIPNPS